jgi:hypothetical protein
VTPSDPYQKTFSTVEELLSNPRGRVRQNPSKGFETILAAVKASDGLTLALGGGMFAYVVLSGPMSGTYVLGQKFNRYKPDFESAVGGPKRADARIKILKVLKPLIDVVRAMGLTVDKPFRPRKSIEQTKAEILDLIDREYDEENFYVPDARAMLDEFTADPKGFTKKRNDEQMTADMVRSPSFKMAEKLYVLSQAGGVPVNTLIEQVKEKPKRLLSLDMVRIPTRLPDRTRYAAEFLRTWSAGVRPLITKSEYKCEGDEMKHCVHSMGYYLKRDGYEFAIAAPDGTRATLELDSKRGTVRQLFGPNDSTPSAATRKMAEAFLAVNRNNIALMRQGRFPVYARDER